MAQDFSKADERGVPSLVWRSGQARRLAMIEAAVDGRLHGQSCVLVDGCGVGMYNQALQQFTPAVHGMDIEAPRVLEAAQRVPNVLVSVGERLPYPSNHFDVVLSHEVIEHVADDWAYASEMARVLKPGGRGVIFCPNRLYPFETHGHYWRGEYHFGNTPFINYLPDHWRNQLAPHVRVYTVAGLQRLFLPLPLKIVSHTRIYPGYDNVVQRFGAMGRGVQKLTHALEKTPLKAFGISHLLVVEKV